MSGAKTLEIRHQPMKGLRYIAVAGKQEIHGALGSIRDPNRATRVPQRDPARQPEEAGPSGLQRIKNLTLSVLLDSSDSESD